MSYSESKLSKYPSTGIYLDPDRAGIRVFKFGSTRRSKKNSESSSSWFQLGRKILEIRQAINTVRELKLSLTHCVVFLGKIWRKMNNFSTAIRGRKLFISTQSMHPTFRSRLLIRNFARFPNSRRISISGMFFYTGKFHRSTFER